LVGAGRAPHPPPGTRFAVTNPQLIVEVLSPETEAPDRGEKFHRYIAMESLQEYVLIAQDTARVETFFKQPDGVWAIPRSLESLDDVWRSRSLPGVELPLAKVYEGIEFPPRKEWTGDPTPDPDRFYTVGEYLDFEMSTEWQYDYRDGTITPKVHPGIDHMTIGMNLLVALGNRFDDTPKRAWMGSVRVAADVERGFLHPDMSVTAEKAVFLAPADNISLTNPVLVIEIVSAETFDDDHGAKFEWYRQIESLREYLLIAEDRARVESFHRRADGAWASGGAVDGLDGIWKSRSLGMEVPLSEIFSDVTFRIDR
jgi:Uma2 family endonuclease